MSQGADLRRISALLGCMPGTLDALLHGLPSALLHANEGGSTWNAVEVVGHLIHGERTDWIPRTHIILDGGDARAFDPFDMEGHRREIEGKNMAALLDEFARLRAANLSELAALQLTPSDLGRTGVHPSLGPVTLGELLAAWAAHDLTHLHQLSRLLAQGFRPEVGPWSQYMGVLQCSGHSSR
ncbi:MAG TPA: DinB family protein [Terriglobales bacterium]|nr:DinB family protein [Terriglobales bacterium]